MEIKAEIIAKICKGEILSGDKNCKIKNFSIDTRSIKEGDMYIALKGENSNGNLFLKQAFAKGAKGVIVEEIMDKNILNEYNDRIIIKVKDGLKALQDLAKYKRELYNIPIIAVTGSVGKTSTKDIIANVISQEYNVLKTEGNYNNHIGLPITLLKLDNHTAVVVEMGMNHLGEISVLSKIAKPTIAVITNIGTAHIGYLGSRENILKAKLEILEGLKENGTFIINNDNDLLNEWNKKNQNKNVITYGINNKSDYTGYNICKNIENSHFNIDINNNTYNIKVPVAGEHFIYNSLCAIAVGKQLGISEEKIEKGILEFKLSAKRMDLKKIKNNITVLEDCYNASYDSMKSSLEVISKYETARKIAVLGNMMELGEFTEELHSKVGEDVCKNKIDILITVGEFAENIAKKAQKLGMKDVYICKNNKEATEILEKIMQENDIILMKASNSMKFSEILENII